MNEIHTHHPLHKPCYRNNVNSLATFSKGIQTDEQDWKHKLVSHLGKTFKKTYLE